MCALYVLRLCDRTPCSFNLHVPVGVRVYSLLSARVNHSNYRFTERNINYRATWQNKQTMSLNARHRSLFSSAFLLHIQRGKNQLLNSEQMCGCCMGASVSVWPEVDVRAC